MNIYYCEKNCCKIQVCENSEIEKFDYQGKSAVKAGTIIYDKKNNKVLLVQARSSLWGFPKGSVEDWETIRECAVRETREETGLDISPDEFRGSILIRNIAMYYFVEREECHVSVQSHTEQEKNDVTGIMWVDIDCLEKLVSDGNVILNQQCKTIFRLVFKKSFPKSGFILVTHRKRRKRKPKFPRI